MGIFDRKPNMQKLEAKRDVKGLIKALKHKDSQAREEAKKALVKLGKVTVDHLVRTLRTEAMHAEALIVEYDGGYERDWSRAESYFRNSEAVWDCIEVLTKMGSPAIGPLIEYLGEIDDPFYGAFVREAIRKALGNIGEPAIEPLIQVLKSRKGPMDNLKNEAERALEEIAERLIERLDVGKEKIGNDIAKREYAWHVDSYEGVWSPYTEEEKQTFDAWDATIKNLAKIGRLAIKPLSEVIRDPNSSGWKRENANEALKEIQKPGSFISTRNII